MVSIRSLFGLERAAAAGDDAPMHLARVIGHINSTEHHCAYDARKLMLVRKLTTDLRDTPEVNMAIDYVGAGPGEIVLVGAAPGLASVVFRVESAPIAELIMGIVDPATLAELSAGKRARQGSSS